MDSRFRRQSIKGAKRIARLEVDGCFKIVFTFLLAEGQSVRLRIEGLRTISRRCNGSVSPWKRFRKPRKEGESAREAEEAGGIGGRHCHGDDAALEINLRGVRDGGPNRRGFEFSR